MHEFLLRRLLLLVPTLIGVTLVVFLMMHFIPGDPVTNMMGEMFSQADVDRLRHELGLDKPFQKRFAPAGHRRISRHERAADGDNGPTYGRD